MPEAEHQAVFVFDDLAEAYDGWFATRLGAFVDRIEKEFILNLLQPKQGEFVLELGSGTGHFLQELARHGARCLGLEPSGAMLAVARRKAYAAAVELVRGRGEQLPFADAIFDAMLCMTALEFVEDIAATIDEAARVVKPGGRMVFGVLNAEGPWARQRRKEGGLWNRAHFFRASELSGLFSRLGRVRLDYCVHIPPQAGRLPAHLFGPANELFRQLLPTSSALIGAQIIRGTQ